MRPKLKISNLIHLQDARYAAAAGFEFVSYSLERGHTKKLPVKMVIDMASWLSGPQTILELNIESLNELRAVEHAFEFAYVSLPFEDWHEMLLSHEYNFILRSDTPPPIETLHTIIEAIEAEDKQVKFEITFSDPTIVKAYQAIYPYLFVHFQSLQQASVFLSELSTDSQPFGISFREEADEDEYGLHYEVLDELLGFAY